ncbi:heavy metal translocating P-type ATPase [Salisaeta longa]|uniref:heavy metal translocating P-type ATPase n=1 Tax=Salisaeta longa TaxID=503170 RepID=UPI001E4BFDB8|nr:cation-translocating P-type ATPase [Salisaeta longa]
MLSDQTGAATSKSTDVQQALLYRLFLGALLAAFTMAISVAISVGYGFRALRSLDTGFDPAHWALLFAAVPALALLAPPLVRAAWRDVRQRRLTLNVLFTLGTGSAVAASIVSYVRGTGPIYLETATMLLALHTLGRYLTARAKNRATRVLDRLLSIPETTYERLSPDEAEVAPDELRVDDQIRLRAGDTVPVDGQIERGNSYIDERSLTGEAQPTVYGPGDAVYAGTQVVDGMLAVRVTAVAEERRLARIEKTVREALRQPTHVEQATDRVMRWLIPGAVVLALVTFGGWYWAVGFQKALYTALSVVLITCPCALSLAVPLTFIVALNQAAERGIVLHSGASLLTTGQAQTVLFDKTGTLSTPDASRLHFTVLPSRTAQTSLVPAAEDAPPALLYNGYEPSGPRSLAEDDCLQLAAAVEAGTRHPLAKAIEQAAAARGLAPLEADEVQTLPGAGVVGVVHARNSSVRVGVGNAKLAGAIDVDVPPEVRTVADTQESAGHSTHFLFVEDSVVAVISLAEQPRAEASAALHQLRADGADVRVLTGDRPEAAHRLAQSMDVLVEYQQSPEDKIAYVQRMRADNGPVVMVGDGINDAAALAAADVGIAPRGGAGQALQAADVALYNTDLGNVAWLRALGIRTRRTIQQNLAWTFVYNAAGLMLAASGLLHPLAAVVIMTLSSLFVTWNALRLRNL